MGIKTILEVINDPDNDLPHLSRSNYYDILNRENKDDLKYHDMIRRIKSIYFELKERYVALGYRMITNHLHREGFKVNPKTVQRLMRKFKLFGYRMKKKKRYDSYEVKLKVELKENLVQRVF